MNDLVIKCSECGADVALTESLAAPLLEASKKDFENRLAQKDRELQAKNAEMDQRRATLEAAEAALDETLQLRMKAESAKLVAIESRKAKAAVQVEIDAKKTELDEANELLKSRTEQLANSKKAEADFLRAKRQLDNEKLELAVTIQKSVNAELAEARLALRNEIEGEVKLKLREKDVLVESMKAQIDSLKKKSEQGSQQIQGGAWERELTDVLTAKFPNDRFTRVAKGESGADIVQEVYSVQGKLCGSILWESKRTKDWNNAWLSKLKTDQRRLKADTAIIVSHVLPKDLTTFDQREDVWVTGPDCVLPVAGALRHLLIEVSITKRTNEGYQDKAALIYQYVTSVAFRQRVKALVDTYTIMQSDLKAEKLVFTKQWAKRHTQLDRMIEAATGMYGDLQGIAGQSVPELDGLGFDALEAGS